MSSLSPIKRLLET